MKESRFSEEEIIRILQTAQSGQATVEAVCRQHSISASTYYKWREKYGGLEVPEARRLRELEKENARLKRLLAERYLELDAVREVLGKK